MVSQRDSNSDAPTEQSTSYFNASFFPESNAYLSDDILSTNYDFKAHFEEGGISSFQTPQSYENLRKRTEAQKNNALILGSTSGQYRPYYPTEEVPITEGLGTDLINWKLLSHGSSSASGTRSQTSDQRTSRTSNSKNGRTPPTVCETATIVNGGKTEFDFNDDIDLDEVRKQDFTYLPRFNKQKDIIKNVDNATQLTEADKLGQYPSLASTASFFPAWEMKSAQNAPVGDPALDNMGMAFAYDADSTVSKSQTQSSVFTGGQRRASGTAPSVTSYTESSIAESSPSEKYFSRRQLMPNYPKYLEDDSLTHFSGYSRFDPMTNEFGQFPISADLQQVLDTALENLSTIPSQPMAPPPLSSHYNPQSKRVHSTSPTPPPAKRSRPKKEHICPSCNANFTEKTNLTRHVKSRKCTRTGPDMFCCPVHECPRSYEGRSDNLKTHMKRVHREEWRKLKSFQGDWREKTSLEGHLYGVSLG